MRQSTEQRRGRAAFTLVELLIVILIIAILFALAAGAVLKALGKADEVRARNDLTQLANGVAAFKQHFQVSYVPDTIVLPPGYDSASLQYISGLFPRINANTLGTGTGTFTIPNDFKSPNTLNSYTVFSYWGVTGTTAMTLHGDQAIVFFLGGKYDPNSGCLGYSSDPTNPLGVAQSLLTGSRIGPFLDFPPNRLASLPANTTYVGLGTGSTTIPARASGFPSYLDVFGLGMPYFYFSSRRAGNDYPGTHRAPSALNLTNNTQVNPNVSWIALNPYWQGVLPGTTVPRYANPNGFQIICAGRDGCFGGGVDSNNNIGGGKYWGGYNSGTGNSDLGGYDNFSNFHPTQMGIPAQ